MKTKQNKIVLTVLSMAAIGLSAAGLQAQDVTTEPINTPVPVQLRDRLNMGRNADKPLLSEELQNLVNQYRENRQALMEAYRANRLERQAEMQALREKYLAGDLTDEERAAAIEEMKAMRDDHRAAAREMRQELRAEMRVIREQIKLERQGAAG